MAEQIRVPTTRRVLAYARSALRNHIANLLDDPSGHLNPWREREPPAALAEIRGLAGDLGLDFDELIAAGSPTERERLAAIEQGRISPSPRDAIPGTAED